MAYLYMYPESKIAAGYNNTGSLIAWESIVPTGDVAFFAPVIYGSFDVGDKKFRLNGTPKYVGFGQAKAGWGVLTQAQRYYLQTTYCAGGYFGEVTMKFRLENPDSYVIANCILDLSKISESRKESQAFPEFFAYMQRLEIIG